MDALDVRIIRAMGLQPSPVMVGGAADALKPARIARKVGVTAETVRERVSRLEASGVIASYEVVPNLRHFGFETSAYLFHPEDDDAAQRVRDAVETVEGIIEVTCFLGSPVCVDLAHRSDGERERRRKALALMAGDADPQPFFGWVLPDVSRPLTALDWRILRAMRKNARRSLVEVADDIGVGYRTVKRHHDRMAAEGSLFIRPILRPGNEPGLVPAGMCFYFRPDADPAAPRHVLAAFDEMTLSSPPAGPHNGAMPIMVFAHSVAEVEQLRRRGQAIDGVERVEALILVDVVSDTAWIDEAIDQEIQRLTRVAKDAVAGPAS